MLYQKPCPKNLQWYNLNMLAKDSEKVLEFPASGDSVSVCFASCCPLPHTVTFEENGRCSQLNRNVEGETQWSNIFSSSAVCFGMQHTAFPQGFVCSAGWTGQKLSIFNVNESVQPQRCACNDSYCSEVFLHLCLRTIRTMCRRCHQCCDNIHALLPNSLLVSVILSEPKGTDCFKDTSN